MKKPLLKGSYLGATLCSLAALTSVNFLTANLAVAANDSSTKILRIGYPFGPTSSMPDPRARQNGWLSNRAGVSETLIGLSYEMQQFPRLAVSYRNLSKTGWEIVIRPDVKFHDGSTMTAQDVKASFDKLDVKGHSAHNPRLWKLLGLKEIKVIDDQTLHFITQAPNSAFLWALTEPSAAVLKEGTKALPIIGTGPFIFESAEANKQYKTRAFADYWNGKPKLDGIVLDKISDPAVAALALKAGDVDLVTNYSEPAFAHLQKNSKGQRFSAETLRLFFFMPRVSDGVLANKALRQALSLGLNRELISEVALAGVGGSAAHSIFPRNMKAWVNRDVSLPYDLKKAHKLLDDAGIKDTDGNGIRELNGKDITLKLRSYEGRAALKPTLEVSQQMLSQLGLKVEIAMGEFGANNNALKAGEIQMNLQAWGTAPQGHPDYFPSTVVASNAGYNFSGYSNPELDELLAKGRAEFDPSKAKPFYDKVQSIINQDLPIIPLFHKTQVSVGNGKVKGYRIHPAETYLATPELDLEQN
ncbi:MAG: ABC transporter substrate-binding protein [Oceanospirillaceae bacterium]